MGRRPNRRSQSSTKAQKRKTFEAILEEEKKTALPAGTIVTSNGTIVFPDGKVILPGGMELVPTTKAMLPSIELSPGNKLRKEKEVRYPPTEANLLSCDLGPKPSQIARERCTPNMNSGNNKSFHLGLPRQPLNQRRSLLRGEFKNILVKD
jgi:hypothetical protein